MLVALFGGSFNPPHVGHLLAATYVKAVTAVDEVWLMPVHRHPFGKSLAPFEARVEMCREMAAHVEGLEVTEVESEVPGEGRTIDTVDFLKARHPEHEFRLVIGADILLETPKWKSFDRLVVEAPLYVLGRGGYEKPARLPPGTTWLGEVEMPRVSSTEIRARLASGGDCGALVPRPVLEKARSGGWYGRPS